MYSSGLLVLAFAVFGASAQSLLSSGCGLLGGVSGISGHLGGGVVGGLSTPVLENVPLRLPSIIHPTTVQDSCNCIKTVVRPQLRKEVFTIPSVQRFVQTTSTPVIETVPYVTGSSVDIPAVGGLVSGGDLSGLNSGIVSGGVVSGGLVSGGVVSSGLVSGGVVSGALVSGGVVPGVVSGINGGFANSC